MTPVSVASVIKVTGRYAVDHHLKQTGHSNKNRLNMNPSNMGMPTGPTGLPQQQQQHNYMQQMQQQQRQNPHMQTQVPNSGPPVGASRQVAPMGGYGQPGSNQNMQAKMSMPSSQGMPTSNSASQVQNKMNMNALPIRTYLDQTVVPILLDGKKFCVSF